MFQYFEQIGLLKHSKELMITESVIRIKIVPQSPSEQNGVLWNQSDSLPQLKNRHASYIDSIKQDPSCKELDNSTQS